METPVGKLVRPKWIVVLLLLLPLTALWRPLAFGHAIGPFDQFSAPGAPILGSGASSRSWDILQADGIAEFYVWRDLVIKLWGSGKPAFWNPYQLFGQPVLANSQSAPFYPGHILMGVLHVPTPLALTLLAWLHLAVAGLGAAALSRRLGANETGSAIAGAAFSLSPFLLAWTPLPSVVTTCCWIPVALASLKAVMDGQPRRWTATALATGMMVLGGHLQFALYGLLALLVCGVWWWIALKPRLMLPVSGILAVAVGLAIAAVQVLPVMEFSKASHRKGAATSEGYAAYVASSIQPWELVGIANPLAPGLPGGKLEGHRPDQAYWPLAMKAGANYAESAIYLTPLVLVGLFCIPLRDRFRHVGAVLLLSLLAFALALGTPVNAALYFGLPGFSGSGSPARVSVLFVLGMCVLAGAGLGSGQKSGSKYPWWPIAAVFALVLGGLTNTLAAKKLPVLWEGLLKTRDAGVDAALPTFGIALFGLVLAGLVWHMLRSERAKPAGLVALVAVVAHLVAVPSQIVPSGPPLPKINEVPPPNTRIAVIGQPWNFFEAGRPLLPANLATLSGIMDTAGYDSLLDLESVQAIKDVNNGDDGAVVVNGNIMTVKRTATAESLKAVGVSQVWTTLDLPHLPPAREVSGYRVHDLGLGSSEGIVRSSSSPVENVTVGVNEIAFHARGPTTVTAMFRNLPGWEVSGPTATLNPGRWISFDLPSGEHDVRLRYVPPGYKLGGIVSVTGLLLALGALLAGKKTGSEANSNDPSSVPVE